MSFYQFNSHLKLSGDPIQPMHAVPKQYVDGKAGAVDGARFQIGTLAVAKLPGFVGDVSSVEGTNNLLLADSGVSPGVKYRVDVDSKGRVISGDLKHHTDGREISWTWVIGKPTTLAGYGITDVVSKKGGTVDGTLASTVDATATLHAVPKSQVDVLIDNLPLTSAGTGDIVRTSSPITPTGFLKVNGGVLSKTTYATLYTILGDTYNNLKSDGFMGQPWAHQAAFNSTQTTAISGWTLDSNALPGEAAMSQPIVTKNRVYLLGYYSETVVGMPTVYTAPIDENGVVGAWTTTGSLPTGVAYALAFITKNRIYLLGGYNGSTTLRTIYTATINNDGSLNAWTTSPIQMPSYLSHASLTVIKNRVYIFGGYTSIASGGVQTASNLVYSAPINADGTIGEWVAATPLPAARARTCVITTNNRVYVLGGADVNYNYVSTVYTAPINADGTLGSWATGTSLPLINGHMQLFTTKSAAYIFGGHNGSALYSTCYMAPIAIDGTLGAWTAIASLDTGIGGGSLFATSRRLYIAGNSATPRNTARYATIVGGVDDYLALIAANVPDTTQFKLPDWSAKETDGLYYYMKY